MSFAYPVVVGFVRACKFLEFRIIKAVPRLGEHLTRNNLLTGEIGFTGENSWDIRIKEGKVAEFFNRISNQGALGLGEMYVEGIWECDDLVEMNRRLMRHGCYRLYWNAYNQFLNKLELYWFNLQTRRRSWEVGEKHYDKGNLLFESFLDSAMNYSCGYWRTAQDLDTAQRDKMDLIAKKLNLKPGMKVLDIGCGWGGLCIHLAKYYGVSVVGVTVSKEQAAYARERCEGLPVEFRLVDYRNLNETFDRIVSVGMFEHVGHRNYRKFFKVAHRSLKDDGLFLLHTIGVNHHDVPLTEPFFHNYIFPNGILPSVQHITRETKRKFVIEDWHNFGHDYSRTLVAWCDKFIENWPKIKEHFDDNFFRLWTYYLKFSAGCFQSRKFQLWQVVLSKNGIEGGYYAAR